MHRGLLHRSHSILMVLTPPPVEASGGQEQYDTRSAWHVVSVWVRLTFSQTYHPGSDIWWPWAVLCKVIVTFWSMQLRMQWTVRHTPSRGTWWPRAVLPKVILTFTVMHQVGLTFGVCRRTKWSGHGKMIDPLENFYIRKTFYPGG